MINYKEFEEKIRTMTAHDIIMSMVEGLRKPKTIIDMDTYGEMKGGICYGCAATNAILHIMNANKEEVGIYFKHRTNHVNYTLRDFEYAVDKLRCGILDLYNAFAKTHGFAQINPIPGQELPKLRNNYTEEQLQEYEKLAEYNKIKEA